LNPAPRARSGIEPVARLAFVLLPDWPSAGNTFTSALRGGAQPVDGLTQPAFDERLALG
jgi:hypothetical protein